MTTPRSDKAPIEQCAICYKGLRLLKSGQLPKHYQGEKVCDGTRTANFYVPEWKKPPKPLEYFDHPQSPTQLDMAFGGASHFRDFMPPMEYVEDVPPGWEQMVSDRFFTGISDVALLPKEGIDPDAAWRHVNTIIGSWEPKHEHKTAAAAWLLARWFESATWQTKGGQKKSAP